MPQSAPGGLGLSLVGKRTSKVRDINSTAQGVPLHQAPGVAAHFEV